MAEYAVVSADLQKDKQVVIDLWGKNLADVSHLEEKYDWHFLNSPFGPGQIWILAADGEPIGTASLGMRPMKFGGTVTTAGVACDLAVNQAHRFFQPALMLQRSVMDSAKGGIRILYGIPNSGGAAVMKYVGYHELCRVHRYAKVLRISQYLQRCGKFGSMVPFIGKMADHGLATLQSFGRSKNERITQFLSCFDERFDELWSRVNSELPLLTVRDRRFLNWRYCECPIRKYKTLGLLTDDKSRLLGYLIYYVEKDSAICVDLLASDCEGLEHLLSSWAAVAWGDGLASLSVSCSGKPIVDALLHQGFMRRSIPPPGKSGRVGHREQCKTLFSHQPHSATERTFADSWYYTEGDSPY